MKTMLFAALLAGFLLISASALAKEPAISVTRIQGDAIVIAADGTSKPAAEGVKLTSSDKLQTGPNCQADIALNGVAGCRLLAGTLASMAGTNTKKSTVTVETGNVILNLQKLPAGTEFELVTPEAVASVRGTQFWGRVMPAGDTAAGTTFAVREGTVDIKVKSSGQTFRVEKGQALDISPDAGAVPAVRPALDEELAAMAQAPDILTNA